ncbi:PEGA domain-containing protein [Sorangium sp. So ce542]|uniref:PEGA domain-containing protein n=1 Tax=Sorangium sp. So ce542 TaxID=3133316 RepID=UPI003F622048
MRLAEARAKYEEALAVWEHPQIRLYLGRVLMHIDLPLLAHDNLRLALKWGPGSLAPAMEQEARAALRRLTEQELAAIEVRCDEPGATVLLDGKPWFVGPGAERRVVMPGEHVVTARKDGYFTVVKSMLVVAGKEASGQVELSADATITQRRWPAWLPWATLGAGAALSLAGGGLMWHAGTTNERADDRVRDACDPSCAPYSRDGYVLEHRLAIGASVAGGATVLTGVILLFMNRPQSYRTEDRGGVNVEFRPAASLETAGLSARIVF